MLFQEYSGFATGSAQHWHLANLMALANGVCQQGGDKMATPVLLRKKNPLRLVSNRAG
jgi:hypothetical protein